MYITDPNERETFKLFFYVVENIPRQMIIGADFMQKWEVSLFPKREDYTVGVDPNAIEIV